MIPTSDLYILPYIDHIQPSKFTFTSAWPQIKQPLTHRPDTMLSPSYWAEPTNPPTIEVGTTIRLQGGRYKIPDDLYYELALTYITPKMLHNFIGLLDYLTMTTKLLKPVLRRHTI